MLRSFGILSPTLGIREDFPSILLKDAYLPDYLGDIKNIIFRDGEIHRAKMRSKEFTQVLPDRVLHYDYYKQKVAANWWLILCTKRDIAYRDAAGGADRLVYITPKETGTASFVNGDETVTAAGGGDFSALKAGDFISIGDTYSTTDKWYEIASIAGGDATLELTGKYAEANTGDVPYEARVTYAGTDLAYWESITFNNKWIATNGVDVFQVWEGADQCAVLAGNPPIAKHIFVYENHIIAGNIVTGPEPYTWEWCSLGAETNWTTGDSGSDQIDGYYPISKFAELQGFLIIITENTLEKAWHIGGDLVFNKRRITDEVGTRAPNSVLKTKEAIYFYSPDNTFRKFTGLSWPSISKPVDRFVKNIHPEYEFYIQSVFSEEYNLILWAVPDSASTGRNTKVLIYDLNTLSAPWSIKHMEVCCFGAYEVEAQLDWDSLPGDTWVDWAWEIWESREGFEKAPHELCSDYSGYTYRLFAAETDDDADYTGEFVLATDLSKNKKLIPYYKRLTKATAVFRNEAVGTVAVYGKRDYETSWQLLGSISLVGTQDFLFLDLFFDLRAKNFLLKFSAENRFRFLGIIFPEFDLQGLR